MFLTIHASHVSALVDISVMKDANLLPAHYNWMEVAHNIIVALTVSFVALSLGASLGVLSGRGAFAGMISAGIIAFITSLLGGTRVQCSGPTAPMSAISSVIVAYAYSDALRHLPHYNADLFINQTVILAGMVLVVAGVLRAGRFITYVPNVVVSGFMSGIAVLIWWGQAKSLFGINGAHKLDGPMEENILIVMATLAVMFMTTPILKRFSPFVARFVPSSLVALVVVALVSNWLELPVEYMNFEGTLTSIDGIVYRVSYQLPRDWSWDYIMAALPFAVQLVMLCYLDTLLTSLVIDRMSGEKTRQNQELMAQGVANGAVALVGGIPGAQATIRSVLVLKEGATMRLAGILVGVFVLVEMLAFQHLITYIPQAVFTAILIKVGYDVFDVLPVKLYLRKAITEKTLLSWRDDIAVSHGEMLFIVSTILVTVLVDLNAAVIGASIVFYALNRWLIPSRPVRDLDVLQDISGALHDEH